MAGSESVEKLEDGIVRSAEQVSGQIRAAKEAKGIKVLGRQSPRPIYLMGRPIYEAEQW